MLPIANTNVANWKLGIGIGNNGNISPRFVQPAKQAFSCTASGGFRVRRAVVPEGWRTSRARRTVLLNVANVKMLPIVNINVANWKVGIGIGNNGNNGNT